MTTTDKRTRSALGAELTLAELETDPHPALARLRDREPVSWVPALDGWLVTRRDLCIEVMRDAAAFTVDEHRRHRDPFARAFLGPDARTRFAGQVEREARTLVEQLTSAGRAEIRRDLAGPLAVNVVVGALELLDVTPAAMLGWYDEIVAAVDRVSTGGEIGPQARSAVDALDRHVDASIDGGTGALSIATETLTRPEIASNAAVMLFGGIETGEGMTTTLFWHLLTNPDQLAALRADRSLGAQAVEESLRLEPAAARVDRYATADVELAGASIRRGDLVIVSLTAANRDPAAYPDPDTFDLSRANARSHLAFAQGPHACVGIHLARLETLSALDAALDAWPGLRLDDGATPPTGLIFRKPRTLPVNWVTG